MRFYHFLLPFYALIFLPLELYCQQEQKEASLIRAIDSCRISGDKQVTARAFLELVKYYDLKSDAGKLEMALDSALFYSSGTEDVETILSIMTYKASYVSDIGNHNEAIEIYREIYKGRLSLGDSVKAADMLVNIGMEYNNLGRYHEALNEELEALRLREKAGDLTNIAAYYQHIGEVYKYLDNNEKWREYCFIADSMANADENYANFFTRISVLNDIGGLYEEDNELEKAAEVYEKMYSLCSEREYVNGMAVALSNLSPVLKKMGQPQKALETSLEALSLSEKMNKTYHIITDLNSAGRLYLELGRKQEAISCFNRAALLADEKSFPSDLADSWNGLYKSYKALGNPERALYYHELEVSLRDSINTLEVKNTVTELETKYETEKKEQQITLLTVRDEYNKKVKTRLCFLIVALVMLSGSVILVLYLRTETVKQQKDLLFKQQEITRLSHEKMIMEIDQKNRELSSVALQMAGRYEFLSDLKEKLGRDNDTKRIIDVVHEIDQQIKNSSSWESFRLHFEEVHPSFFKRLKESFPSLSANEEKLCAFIILNLSSKEIANLNNNTVAAVDKSRNRLRKKLGLEPDESLRSFLEKV